MTSTELDTLLTQQPPQIATYMRVFLCDDQSHFEFRHWKSNCRECLTELIAALMARGRK
jgi:hypothetical protein